MNVRPNTKNHMQSSMTADLASRFVKIALSHATREFPAKMDHILTGPTDIQGPRAFHPMFYGSFDWHSCVHTFWLMAKILRLFPNVPQATTICALFDEHLTNANAAAEMNYFKRPMQDNFERPYGWAWLLMLASELEQHGIGKSQVWRNSLRPFTQFVAAKFKDYVLKLPYPIRAGTHPNTAFVAALAIEYAQVVGDAELQNAVCARMQVFFDSDADSRAFEPSGNEFHSPILIEVECMRRVLEQAEFLAWLDRFLPHLAQRDPKVLFKPVPVRDHADPQIVHLDGLNFSRAWCWRSLAQSLPAGDSRRELVLESAEDHIAQSLPHLNADYMAEHWLTTYALLALTA